MLYKFMGLLCFVVGTVVSLSPLLVGNPYQVEQTIILLLGLIGFGLFRIAESIRVQTGLSASSIDSNLNGGSADKVDDTEMQVLEACRSIGHGRVLQLASEDWQKKAAKDGQVGVGFVIGPHVGLIENCGCGSELSCEWCCGTGWLTKHVKSLKDD